MNKPSLLLAAAIAGSAPAAPARQDTIASSTKDSTNPFFEAQRNVVVADASIPRSLNVPPASNYGARLPIAERQARRAAERSQEDSMPDTSGGIAPLAPVVRGSIAAPIIH